MGRSSACLYPAAATNLPSVGAYSAPSIERIVALAPTHVLMTYLSDPSMSNRLERLGVRVLQFPCERLADYAPMRARLAALCGLVPRRMLAVVQREPLIVAGRETLPDDVLAEVGCANAVTNRKGYFVLSPEERVKLAPEGEVDFSMDYDLTRLGPKLPAAIDELRRKLAATATGGASCRHGRAHCGAAPCAAACHGRHRGDAPCRQAPRRPQQNAQHRRRLPGASARPGHTGRTAPSAPAAGPRQRAPESYPGAHGATCPAFCPKVPSA